MGTDPRYENTHRQIVSCAIEKMSQSGFDQVTIEEICGAVGVSRSTFYYHFKTKQDIVSAYFTDLGELTPQRLAHVFDAPTACEKAVRMQLSYFTNRENTRNPELYIVHMKNFLSHPGRENEAYERQMQQVLLPLIRQAQAQGEIRNRTTAERLCDAATSIQWGNMYQWCIQGGSFDRVLRLKEALIALYDMREDIAQTVRGSV